MNATMENDIRREALIVSPYFPPSTVAGVHRARHLAKHLPTFDWRPLVVCVDEVHHEQQLDPDLVELLPGGVDILKVGAAPVWLTRRIGVGEIGLRAWLQLRRAVLRAIATRPVGAVLITGAPFYPMLLASEIKRYFKVPIVLDFQDPWVSTWGAAQSAASKSGLTHRLAKILEPRALRAADFVTSVSDIQNAEMAARYQWLDASRMAAIPIGGDPEDFSATKLHKLEADANNLEPGLIHLSYIGTFLPRSAALLRTLFRAIVGLRSTEPALAARIRLNFIGTSNQPGVIDAFRVRPIAEAEGVADIVREIPERLPYFRALKLLVQSNGLLLIGSDEPHYTASKIYPALMSGRPYLSIFHRESSAHSILSSAGGGIQFAFKNQVELDELVGPLIEGLKAIALDPKSIGYADPAAYGAYKARSIAERFAGIFDRLVTVRSF